MKSVIKYVGLSLFLAFVFTFIGYLFWQQEVQYTLPTPVPDDYQIVYVNQSIHLDNYLKKSSQSPILYHFFSPECPCSRFNLKHFNSLKRKFGDRMEFVVVIPEYSDLDLSTKYFEGELKVIRDTNRTFANELGVYSTPQAAIISKENRLYYRGNYNRSRYCTDPGSNFVQMALDSLFSGAPAPAFGLLSTVSYGCGLAEESKNIFSMY
ncbi:hypothetical protein SAMN04488029_3757 [Reichenbachiella faecimaris]|uniref:DUF6436 domain-containing protein n=1 Tax=Reichenbachiella faecimaris TaxID=692418 RepID=A0A1W2GNW8_REIFA|nr:hypothetical protein [Reichenbachiella faecimaris]SMD38343.1 hypothetical protein SAMN04488029_3757 [Reichenbachiella faecimaris]